MEEIDPGILLEVREGVADALGRFGVAGEVRVEPTAVILFGHGPTVREDVTRWLGQWDRLSPEVRLRRCAEVARNLAQQRRSAPGSAHATRRGLRVPDWIAPLGIAGLAVTAVVFVWRVYSQWLGPGQGIEASAATSAESPIEAPGGVDERQARAARVCDATRSRIMRGATVSPADVEGWVVELALLRSVQGMQTPETGVLEGLLERTGGKPLTITWTGVPKLRSKTGHGTYVKSTVERLAGQSGSEWQRFRLSFSEHYVDSFFEERERVEYFLLANEISKRYGAEYAALYARCIHRSSHHVGTWFRGSDPAGAVTALIYFIGLAADLPHLHPSALGRQGDGEIEPLYALKQIADAARDLDKDDVAVLLGPHGGMISGAEGSASVVTFPFRDSNRASRASLAIARHLGIGLRR